MIKSTFLAFNSSVFWNEKKNTSLPHFCLRMVRVVGAVDRSLCILKYNSAGPHPSLQGNHSNLHGDGARIVLVDNGPQVNLRRDTLPNWRLAFAALRINPRSQTQHLYADISRDFALCTLVRRTSTRPDRLCLWPYKAARRERTKRKKHKCKIENTLTWWISMQKKNIQEVGLENSEYTYSYWSSAFKLHDYDSVINSLIQISNVSQMILFYKIWLHNFFCRKSQPCFSIK